MMFNIIALMLPFVILLCMSVISCLWSLEINRWLKTQHSCWWVWCWLTGLDVTLAWHPWPRIIHRLEINNFLVESLSFNLTFIVWIVISIILFGLTSMLCNSWSHYVIYGTTNYLCISPIRLVVYKMVHEMGLVLQVWISTSKWRPLLFPLYEFLACPM